MDTTVPSTSSQKTQVIVATTINPAYTTVKNITTKQPPLVNRPAHPLSGRRRAARGASRTNSGTKGHPNNNGNLLFIAHWDEEVQRWFVHDVAGDFTPDQLTPPPGVAIPPNPEIGILNELEPGKLYDFHVDSNQIVNIVEGETGDWHFNAGTNFIKWSR